MDIFTPEKRSWVMSRIQGKDTKPEKKVRSMLHSLGYRFRLHVKNLPGKPDIVLPRYRIVIFVHGCFWHRHKGCRYAYEPKSRIEFWKNKLEGNVSRDRKVRADLKKLGWDAKVIWECEVEEEGKLLRKIKHILH